MIPLFVAVAILSGLAPGATVEYRDLGPSILGVACNRDWADDPLARTDLCGEVEYGIVLNPQAIKGVALARNVIAHEAFHLTHEPTASDGPFEHWREAEAYQASCEYQWVWQCRYWRMQ